MAKNYLTVEPDYTRLMQKHFNAGRAGNKIEFIVRHHAAGILTTDQMWQVWQSRQASAHYNVEVSGRVGQLVYDGNTAWATGNTRGNQCGISIEHSNSGGAAQDWPIADATIDEGARWAAALCRYYKLGRPQYGRNVFDHRDFFATSCGYHLANGNRYHQRWMRVAQEFYDELAKPAAPAPAPAPKPTPQEDVMAADLNTRITVADGKEYRAQDLIKWTDERVYELTREGGRLDRLEAKIDRLLGEKEK